MNWPRVALLLAMTLRYLTRSDGKSEIVLIGVSVVAPFKESEQLRSHEETSGSNVETDQPLKCKVEHHRGDARVSHVKKRFPEGIPYGIGRNRQ